MLGDGKHNPAAVAAGQVKKNITHVQYYFLLLQPADAASPILTPSRPIVAAHCSVGQVGNLNWYSGKQM
jgi:hypothetical protein